MSDQVAVRVKLFGAFQEIAGSGEFERRLAPGSSIDDLWRELAAANGNLRERDRLAVYEQLAICYEHRLDDQEAATEVTRKAMREVDLLLSSAQEDRRLYRRAQRRFAHRLRRLTRKESQQSLAGRIPL